MGPLTHFVSNNRIVEVQIPIMEFRAILEPSTPTFRSKNGVCVYNFKVASPFHIILKNFMRQLEGQIDE